MENKKQITIRNLGKGHHIFGAAYAHEDLTKHPVLLHATESLAPGAEISMSKEQFKFYDDEALKRRVDTREFAVLVDGRDIRPDLARRERVVPKELRATESDAAQETSVLAEILAENDPKPE